MATTLRESPGNHRKGLSVLEAGELFGTDEAAEAWFAECRWGGEPGCPSCGSANVQVGAKHPTMPYRCRSCRRFFSVKTGTAMQSSKLGLRAWAIAIYLITTELWGRASIKLHRDLGITRKAAWHLAHRVHEAWETGRRTPFKGPVEVGASYLGGLELNTRETKKLKASRGLPGKRTADGARSQFADVTV